MICAGPAGRTVNRRRGVPVDDIAWRFPGDPAATCIHGDNVCVGVLIADEDHSSVGIDGRCNQPVLTVKWSEWQLPSLFTLEIISQQAEISKEDKDAVSIGDCGRRCAVIQGVLGFVPGSSD
jgi:hypothetical protein